MPTSQGFRGLRVYQLAFKLAMEIYHESKKFPSEERYSLTDQIRRASRSVAGLIGEGYRRKLYPKVFVNKMSEADGEGSETQVWIDFAYACDDEVMDAFQLCSRLEGIIPALESTHALVHGLKRAKKMRREEILVINLSGRGDKDVNQVAKLLGVKLS